MAQKTANSTISVRDFLKSVSSARSMFGASQSSDGVSTTGSTTQSTTASASRTGTAPSSMATQAPLACFHIEEIVPGEILESHRTYEVHEIRTIKQNHKEELPMQQHSRDCMTELLNNVKKNRTGGRRSGGIPSQSALGSSTSATPSTGGKRFVMKHIRKECMESQQLFEEAASKLENEATMMKGLCHPSIPRLRGMSLGGTEAYYCTGRYDSFFLVTERIEEFLKERIVRWRTRDMWFLWRNLRGVIKRKRSERLFVAERLRVALDIAEGLRYMHEHGICHRSLDATGIGFTASNQVQILRFGDARKHAYESPQALTLFSNSMSNSTISPLTSKQLSSKKLSSLLSSTKAPSLTSPSQLIVWNGSVRASDNSSTGSSDEKQPFDNDRSAGMTISSGGFEDDVLGYSKILCEILTMRSFGGETAETVNMGRRGKACMRDFRSLATKIPGPLLELLQRGLSDLAESRPTMSEFCICVGDAHFNLIQGVANTTAGKDASNASECDTSNTPTRPGPPLYQFRHHHGQSTRRGTQLGLRCEGFASEEFNLLVSNSAKEG